MDLKSVEKLAIFQRGQSIVSAKIMKFLYFFFLGKIRQKTCLVTFQIENQHFQTIKTWIKKNSQNWHFSKGNSACFRPKLSNFFISFFQVRYVKKKCFVTFYIENQHFQTIKTWIKKSRKMDNFPKGPVHGFRENHEICLFHLFR